MRPQFLQDMIRCTAAFLATQTTDCIVALLAVVTQGCLPPPLASLLASASLVDIPKPAGGIRPIVVGLILRRIAGQVALQLPSDGFLAYLQPLQLGVGISWG